VDSQGWKAAVGEGVTAATGIVCPGTAALQVQMHVTRVQTPRDADCSLWVAEDMHNAAYKQVESRSVPHTC
jgi:ABC-type Zn2+ transport system substrate-binding protein/surface adhesin